MDRIPELHRAVLARDADRVRELIAGGADPRQGLYPFREFTSALDVARERGYAEIVAAIEAPRLWDVAGTGDYATARRLLEAGAGPNEAVPASGSPLMRAYSEGDEKMIALFGEFGGVPEATTAGLFRQTELARRMLAGEAAYRLDVVGGETPAEQLLWGGACGGDPEIVRMALARVEWVRQDLRWFEVLEQPLRVWSFGSVSRNWDRGTYPVCFRLLLERADPNLIGRFGVTILHCIAGARSRVTGAEQVAFAEAAPEAGARADVRDPLFERTPLEWADRLNRPELAERLRNHV